MEALLNIAEPATHDVPQPQTRLVRCLVRVITPSGTHAYSRLFASTCDAVTDAMNRFGHDVPIRVKKECT